MYTFYKRIKSTNYEFNQIQNIIYKQKQPFSSKNKLQSVQIIQFVEK